MAGSAQDLLANPATLVADTKTGIVLDSLPRPRRKLDVSVYNFPDLTGQNKPNDNFAEFSRALTQGASAVLIDVLTKAGGGAWFDVVERNDLQPLLQERQIIQNTRTAAEGDKAPSLPPLRFAGILLEGGIIGYDTDTKTGGVGARYLGIGGNVKFRQDTITMYLRAISTKSGEVLLSTVAHKTIVSVAIQGDAFKFVDLDKILEAEGGVTTNEPGQIAVQQAIEKAVHALIIEGASHRLWAFADKAYQTQQISRFNAEQFNSGPIAVRAEPAAGWAASADAAPAAATESQSGARPPLPWLTLANAATAQEQPQTQ